MTESLTALLLIWQTYYIYKLEQEVEELKTKLLCKELK